MREVTVTVHRKTATVDDLGDSTSTDVTQVVKGVLFEPQQAWRSLLGVPGVTTTPAKFYFPIALPLDADDVVEHDGTFWQVLNGAQVWTDDRTVVPVSRVSRV